MELPKPHLQHAARYETKTRVIRCSDGLTRHISMSEWHWEKLDFMFQVMPNAMQDFPGFCSFVAKEYMAQSEIDFETAFRKAVINNIFIYYHRFIKHRDDIANDF